MQGPESSPAVLTLSSSGSQEGKEKMLCLGMRKGPLTSTLLGYILGNRDLVAGVGVGRALQQTQYWVGIKALLNLKVICAVPFGYFSFNSSHRGENVFVGS